MAKKSFTKASTGGGGGGKCGREKRVGTHVGSKKNVNLIILAIVVVQALVSAVLYQQWLTRSSTDKTKTVAVLKREESPCVGRTELRGQLNNTDLEDDGFCDCPTLHPEHNDEQGTSACSLLVSLPATGSSSSNGLFADAEEQVRLDSTVYSVVDSLFTCRQDPPPLLDSSALPSIESEGGLFSFVGANQHEQAPRGLPRRKISSSFVDDGICDCCDCSDETDEQEREVLLRRSGGGRQQEEDKEFAEDGTTGTYKLTVISNRHCRLLWKESRQKLDSQLHMVKKGHSSYMNHVALAASTSRSQNGGVTTWRDTLISEIQGLWEIFTKKQKKFNRKIEKFQSGELEPPSTEKEMRKLQKEEMALTVLNAKMTSIQGLLESGALGEKGEYFSLWKATSSASSSTNGGAPTKCLSTVRHEKQFRGGSADPDEYETYFEVCLFHNVTQRRATIQETLTKWDLPSVSNRSTDSSSSPSSTARQIPAEVQADLEKWNTDRPSALKEDVARLRTASLLGYWSTLQHSVNNLSYAGRSRFYHNNNEEEERKRKVRHHVADPHSSNPIVLSQIPAALAATLGSSREEELATRHNVSLFTGGDQCWEGPPRQVRLVFVCYIQEENKKERGNADVSASRGGGAGGGAEDQGEEVLLSVHENGKCLYEVTVGTPRACNDRVLALARERVVQWEAIHKL